MEDKTQTFARQTFRTYSKTFLRCSGWFSTAPKLFLISFLCSVDGLMASEVVVIFEANTWLLYLSLSTSHCVHNNRFP